MPGAVDHVILTRVGVEQCRCIRHVQELMLAVVLRQKIECVVQLVTNVVHMVVKAVVTGHRHMIAVHLFLVVENVVHIFLPGVLGVPVVRLLLPELEPGLAVRIVERITVPG